MYFLATIFRAKNGGLSVFTTASPNLYFHCLDLSPNIKTVKKVGAINFELSLIEFSMVNIIIIFLSP